MLQNMYSVPDFPSLNPNPSIEEISENLREKNITFKEKLLNEFFNLNLKEVPRVSTATTPKLTLSKNDLENITFPKESLKSDFTLEVETNLGTVPIFSPKSEFNSKINLNDLRGSHPIVDEILDLSLSQEDKEYLILLAKQESGYNPYITNKLGYYGLYQFGKSALEQVDMTKKDFLSTKNQHKAALKYAEFGEKVNKDLFDKYIGTYRDGVLITKNGLRAINALLGPTGAREWLTGEGKTAWTSRNNYKDKFGTSPLTYLKLFT